MESSLGACRVAIYAPNITINHGGVWQFYQLVASQVSQLVPVTLVAPAKMLAELNNRAGISTTSIPFEEIINEVPTNIAQNFLLHGVPGRGVGVPRKLVKRLLHYARRMAFDKVIAEPNLKIRLQQENVNIVHVTSQQVYLPSLVSQYPYIINPHDYQHEHFPQYFTSNELFRRRVIWYKHQRNAAAIVVHSQQTRLDAIKHLKISEDRVFYAPYGPVDTFPEPDDAGLRATQEEFSLPERYLFYPARSWPHKNHIGLIDAIHLLKRRGVEVNAVFTVMQEPFGEVVKKRITDLGLESQVKIVGHVNPVQMGALYRLCTMVVVPSLFEQNSGPMLEAIHFGKAVAVSNLDELVSTLDGAGEVFDPRSVQEIASSIDQLWSSESALAEAEGKISERRAQLSWEPFQEIYRKAYDYAERHAK